MIEETIEDDDLCSCGHPEVEHITVSTFEGTALGCPLCDCERPSY